MENNDIKGEKILISLAILMIALLIGYNAFFVNEAKEVSDSYSVLSEDENEKSNINLENDKNLSININKATLEELKRLQDIGDSKAKNIINYRESHGGFSKIEEIINVKGISKNIFEKIKDYIYV